MQPEIMKAVPVTGENVNDFIGYCRKYAHEHDESFIPRDDFIPGQEECSYLLLNADNEPVGAASLMLQKEFREIRKSRFRIFHCAERTYDNFKLLLESVLNDCDGIDNVFCFILENKADVREIWESLGFTIKRYSWVLERDTQISTGALPAGYELRKMSGSNDEDAWCEIINASFADIEGHTRMHSGRLAEMRKEKEYMDDGMLIAWNEGKPAGLLKLIKINEEGEDIMFIETLAVHPAFQGRGLGKALLRYGVSFGKDMGLKRSMLTVNAENSNAANLYLKEGFNKTVEYICYHYYINK